MTSWRCRFEVLLPHLNERQRRLLLGAEARLLGHGGVRAVARAAGVSETHGPQGRVRAGGRRGSAARTAGSAGPAEAARAPRTWTRAWLPALLALVEPDERGDPMSPLRWTTKSLRHLAEELTRQGHPVSAPTVGRLLQRARVQPAGQRQDPGGQAAPRPGCPVPVHQRAGQGPPGGRRAGDQRGREEEGAAGAAARRPGGSGARRASRSRSRITASSSPARTSTQAIPYGIYDLAADTGWVNVGVDHDTSAFAVASIRRWWQARGRPRLPGRRPGC